jgi:hypothetical protein
MRITSAFIGEEFIFVETREIGNPRSYLRTRLRYGRGAGVGRVRGVGPTLGVGVALGVGVGVGVGVTVAVAVAVAVAVGVAVGVEVGVGATAQYLPPVLETPVPPQTIISLPVQTAV